eukprot:TRINITY_DN17252_c0_g1_i1.p1 TRINITY_DN17252_c0_g1~~TRINITY_DN17252_c0_g1_i1.p1  ORF type:complete len:207 (+),score=33.32 TRINITY_DN17252_c0_g1_i1:26-622(+)
MSLAFLFFFVCLSYGYTSDGFSFKIQPDGQRCFDDDFEAPSTVLVEVTSLLSTEVEMKVMTPSNELIAQLDVSKDGGENSAGHVFIVEKAGVYTFCFQDKSVTGSKVHMKILSETGKAKVTDADQKVINALSDLSNFCKSLNADMSRLHTNNRLTERVLLATQDNVIWWSVAEMVGVVLVNGAFCWYLKKSCEIRRTV